MLQRQHFATLTCLDMHSGENNGEDIIVMLHGYGSNEKDLIQLTPYLGSNLHAISARAPLQLDMEMYGWFPIEFTPEGITVDYPAAREASNRLNAFLHAIIDHYQPKHSRVWLMGFSQGAVMSYLTALFEPSILNGVIALSGQFPEAEAGAMPQSPLLRDLPFLVVHGEYDDVLPVMNGRRSRQWLSKQVNDLSYMEYPMGHEINSEELNLIGRWLDEQRSKKQ
ncbi:phospholipase [Prosthecochloris sp. ZM]|uniref:alpha/beta hydrolase n=1 Tax=unclassified Prosthecochloris TaxID=2632826 RepID=UPI000DF817B2|nr:MULTISPECIES: phospholipase [unclassified Prosthecochloris]NEX11510.1 phospholipase [Prosthecochloris sp.]RDD29559.1 phospholipase [Prosthecochloris sp. ZM]